MQGFNDDLSANSLLNCFFLLGLMSFHLTDTINLSTTIFSSSCYFPQRCFCNFIAYTVVSPVSFVLTLLKYPVCLQGCYPVIWLPAGLHLLLSLIDSFTVSLHKPNGRQMPAVRAMQGDCQWPRKKCRNSHQSCEPTIPIVTEAIPTYI